MRSHNVKGNFCTRTTPNKFRYLTLEDAWRAAWKMFAFGQPPLTPYYCHRARVYSGSVKQYTQRNPWRWSPATVTTYQLRRINDTGRARTSCRGWHLTRSTAHVLPR